MEYEQKDGWRQRPDEKWTQEYGEYFAKLEQDAPDVFQTSTLAKTISKKERVRRVREALDKLYDIWFSDQMIGNILDMRNDRPELYAKVKLGPDHPNGMSAEYAHRRMQLDRGTIPHLDMFMYAGPILLHKPDDDIYSSERLAIEMIDRGWTSKTKNTASNISSAFGRNPLFTTSPESGWNLTPEGKKVVIRLKA